MIVFLFDFWDYIGANEKGLYESLAIHKGTMMYTRLRQAQKTMMPLLDENISHEVLINVLVILRKDKL
jgi:hypothetical protein